MISRGTTAAVGVIAMLALSGLYVGYPTIAGALGSHSSVASGLFSFQILSGSAFLDSSSGETNATLHLLNDGTVPIKLGGVNAFTFPARFVLVQGTFHAYFYSANGTKLVGQGNGLPPDTAGGGTIDATFALTGASNGDIIEVNVSVSQGGSTVSRTVNLVVGSTVSSTSTTTTSIITTSHTTTSTSTTSTTKTTTTTSTVTSTTTSTTSKTTTSKTTTTYVHPVSFYFKSASATYDSGNGQTSIVVVIVNNGSQALAPAAMKNIVPPGTVLVTGTWSASYYRADGSYICTAPKSAGPVGCTSNTFPEVANGGHIVVVFSVTGATMGETLTLTYSGQSYSFIVT